MDILNNSSIKDEFSKMALKIDFELGVFPSTQGYAKKLLPINDTVIISLYQNQGMGRKQRSFLSNPGGCFFSLIKSPKTNVLDAIPIMSVAISQVLQKHNFICQIKWPNDILIGNKKICGMLCDVVGDKIILGVGLNVYNDVSPLSNVASSLSCEGDVNISRSRLIAEIIFEYYKLEQKDFAIICNEYQKRLNVMKRQVKINQNGKIITGKVTGLTPQGFLRISSNNGDSVVMSGDLKVIK